MLILEADLLLLLIAVAPNGCLLPCRLESAIIALEEEARVNFTTWSLRDFAETVGERIRIALSKLRDIKRVVLVRARCERKALNAFDRFELC